MIHARDELMLDIARISMRYYDTAAFQAYHTAGDAHLISRDVKSPRHTGILLLKNLAAAIEASALETECYFTVARYRFDMMLIGLGIGYVGGANITGRGFWQEGAYFVI